MSHISRREQRERQMRRFKSAAHAQLFLSVHGLVQNLFRLGRHAARLFSYCRVLCGTDGMTVRCAAP